MNLINLELILKKNIEALNPIITNFLKKEICSDFITKRTNNIWR